MTQSGSKESARQVQILNSGGRSPIVLVCEHASHVIPASFNHLGLPADMRKSHAAWDIGAMGLARRMSEKLDASLIAGAVSRLVYDCNRPPSAEDAMPARSEVIDIPGNASLSEAQRTERTTRYYEPFRAALSGKLTSTTDPVVVTIHSFTPIYHGKFRPVEIGILHDSDSRLADAMLSCAPAHTTTKVERNLPYGPKHGVTHTLQEHAIPNGHLNVMLEVRNDLIQTVPEQLQMADMIADWIADALSQVRSNGDMQCSA